MFDFGRNNTSEPKDNLHLYIMGSGKSKPSQNSSSLFYEDIENENTHSDTFEDDGQKSPGNDRKHGTKTMKKGKENSTTPQTTVINVSQASNSQNDDIDADVIKGGDVIKRKVVHVREKSGPAIFEYVANSVVGKDTIFDGPYGPRQGKCLVFSIRR